ncbi:MAG: type II toxin-antitoxin system RelE/ParE family toxin [Holophagales bacterium]|nr:type II toxin-antitoxin system RelE/ParE family toxin [Holophagales bacterium]MYH24490.1 type II toxin-antitoxin system RelE/ParE family toxin [Holophagales bacterium]
MAVYRLSRKAASDIEDIYSYTIEQHGLASARKYLNGLHSCFELLAEYPMLGRRADRIAPGVRRHEFQAHVVFYVQREGSVRIARVLHARMDVHRRYRGFV